MGEGVGMKRRVQRQIEGILEGNALGWTEEGGDVFLRFDSALVRIGLADWGTQTLIQIRSNVLTHLDGGEAASILREANRLNCETSFGKWVYYADETALCLEYDLLADHLQEAELMTALAAVARLADSHDDTLKGILGGRRAFDLD